MKNLITLCICLFALGAFAQVQMDKSIQLTGSGSDAKIEGIQEILNNNDAANKIYVDTSIANALGGGCSTAPSTPGSISGDALVCAGTTGSYFVAAVAGADTYSWTYSGTGATVSGNSSEVTIAFSSSATSGNLSVSASNGCGSSGSSSSFYIAVIEAPNANFTPSTTAPSFAQSVSYTSADNSNDNYYWTFPDGSHSTTDNPSKIWTLIGESQVTLVATKNGCSSSYSVAMGTPAPSSGTQVFSYTGQSAAFVVPSGVSSVTIDAYGAKGAWAASAGGAGGRAQGSLAVSPGQTLYIYVGGMDGYNGGGTGSYTGGGGSDVRTPTTSLSDRVIVAGGGGGPGGNGTNVSGGAGGGLTGGTGSAGYSGGGGGGGTQSGGGSGGGGTSPGTSGSLGQGGDSSSAGGGGGGYYGGGGGGRHSSYGPQAGGGGSSYIGGVSGGSTTSGVRSNHGEITLSW